MSSCAKETNEGLNDKNDSTITAENSQPLRLGQFKASDHSTPQRGFARTNLSNEVNNLVSPDATIDMSRNTSDSMSETSLLKMRNEVINQFLSKNHSDTRSIASLPQVKNKATNSDAKDLNTIRDMNLVKNKNNETINNLKNLDRNKNLKRLTDLLFNYEVNSTHALLMHREICNVKGINEDSNAFQTAINYNEEENKECEDENSATDVQQVERDTNTKKYNNERKSWLDLSSQCDAI